MWPHKIAQGGTRSHKTAQDRTSQHKIAQDSTRWHKAAQDRARSHKMAQARTKLHKIAQDRTKWHKIAQGHTTTSRYQEAFDFSIDFWSMFAPNLNPQVLKNRAPAAARTRLLTNRPSKLTSMFDHMLVPTWNHFGTQNPCAPSSLLILVPTIAAEPGQPALCKAALVILVRARVSGAQARTRPQVFCKQPYV